MALRTAVVKEVTGSSGAGDQSCWVATWSGIVQGDTMSPVTMPKHSDKSIHAFGVFGAGGSISLNGSNDLNQGGYAPLNTPASVAIAITADGAKAVLENTVFVKPVLTSGDGTTALTVCMLFHLSNPMRQ